MDRLRIFRSMEDLLKSFKDERIFDVSVFDLSYDGEDLLRSSPETIHRIRYVAVLHMVVFFRGTRS